MKKIVGIGISLVLICNMSLTTFASDNDVNMKDTDGKEVVEDVADELMEEQFSEEEESEIEDDLECLDNVNIPIEQITEANQKKNGDMVYEIELGNDIVNTLEVSENKDDNLEIDVTEGKIHNTIRYDENGTLYIDDVKVDYENAMKTEDGFECSGYSDWQKKCPKKIKTWGKKYLLSKCGNLKLPRAVKYLTTTALGAYLGGLAVVKCIGYIGVTYDFAAILKGYDPTATAVSFKVYARNSKKPIGIQNRKSYWYSEKNYKDCIYTANCYAFRWV